MRASDLKDKEVIGQTGQTIGKVKDGDIDDSSWVLTDLEVELMGNVAKEIHVKKTFGSTTIPIPVKFVTAVGDRVMLNASSEQIEESLSSKTAKK
jgi:sporulation protein YlmC with PRC-barrel domain